MILPIISVYALATFKLMPALQQIYMNIGNIKANISAFESIQLDLENSNQSRLKSFSTKKWLLVPSRENFLRKYNFLLILEKWNQH